jgi:hypothetical protein
MQKNKSVEKPVFRTIDYGRKNGGSRCLYPPSFFQRVPGGKQMFGFEKKEKVQLRSVEDYLRTQEVLGDAPPRTKQAKGKADFKKQIAGLSRLKSFIGPVVGIIFILVLVGAALSQFNGLRSEIAAIKAQKSDDIRELRTQLAEITEKADKSEKRANELAERVTGLERALQAETAERIKAEQAAKKAALEAANKARKTAAKATSKGSPKSPVRRGR